MEIVFGLGMYCIGGFVIGCVLAVPIGIAIAWQRAIDERLAKEAARRLKEYEAGEREAYRLDKNREVG